MNHKRGERPANRHASRLAADQPSTYIRSIDSIQPGDKVRLWCRVSTDDQYANGNLADQEAELRTAIRARGGIVTSAETRAGSAHDAEAWLYRAANRAAREGAVLLAESISRFARHPDYHSKKRPHLMAGMPELKNLRWVCGDVPLVTLHDPDISWKEERTIQTKRGQRQKGRHGGRPLKKGPGYKKQRREKLLPKVKRLVDEGMSHRAIARMLKMSDRNVRRWVRRF